MRRLCTLRASQDCESGRDRHPGVIGSLTVVAGAAGVLFDFGFRCLGFFRGLFCSGLGRKVGDVLVSSWSEQGARDRGGISKAGGRSSLVMSI